MWLNRMFKDRQEIIVLGELMLFMVAWVLGIAAAVQDYRERNNVNAGNNVAAKSDMTLERNLRPSAPVHQRLYK